MDDAPDRALYYIDGAADEGGSLVISCGPTDEPGDMRSTLLFRLGSVWARHEVDVDSIVSVAFFDHRLFALGEDGHVLAFGSARPGRISLNDINSPRVERLPTFAELIRLRSVGTQLLAAGMDGQLYVSDGQLWMPQQIPLRDIMEFRIQDMAGFSKDDYYLAGLGGWLVHWNGRWRKIALPTDQHLSSACIGPDDTIYIAGDQGVLLRGRGDRWELVTCLDSGDNMWGLACFQGNIYANTSNAIYVLAGDGWRKVDIPGAIEPLFNRLYATKLQLYSIGELEVASFDGTAWTKVDVPTD
jgi:hypothetical protein